MTEDAAFISREFIFEELRFVGDFWNLIIVHQLRGGPRRFSEIEREVDGLNAVTLTNRLRLLIEEGMVERLKEPGKKAVAYTLTAKGRDLLPILNELWKFGQKHFDAKAWSLRQQPTSI
ncbi:MAG: transcriptional regulator, HxlR family [Devosia sp.]|uniref:winged helix-turn-helix transcriptional regulator n=1 Tax=Devosia sp. TaxID=1871048 RepID=UPI00261FDBF9|nr:helix-turn-helix domain-containing protein [Devosia sp.]MDB5527321.1 transcriptional regulator, HxlR family [Devosia sp.]